MRRKFLLWCDSLFPSEFFLFFYSSAFVRTRTGVYSLLMHLSLLDEISIPIYVAILLWKFSSWCIYSIFIFRSYNQIIRFSLTLPVDKIEYSSKWRVQVILLVNYQFYYITSAIFKMYIYEIYVVFYIRKTHLKFKILFNLNAE